MTKSSPQLATYAHAKATLLDASATNEQLRAALNDVAVQLRLVVGSGVPKVDAARLLGISRPSLDRWIAMGKIKTVVSGKRTLVDPDDLAALLIEVERVRELGETRGIVSAAVHRLAQRDPEAQIELLEMLAPGLAALERDDLIVAVVPESFGSDD